MFLTSPTTLVYPITTKEDCESICTKSLAKTALVAEVVVEDELVVEVLVVLDVLEVDAVMLTLLVEPVEEGVVVVVLLAVKLEVVVVSTAGEGGGRNTAPTTPSPTNTTIIATLTLTSLPSALRLAAKDLVFPGPPLMPRSNQCWYTNT